MVHISLSSLLPWIRLCHGPSFHHVLLFLPAMHPTEVSPVLLGPAWHSQVYTFCHPAIAIVIIPMDCAIERMAMGKPNIAHLARLFELMYLRTSFQIYIKFINMFNGMGSSL